MTSRHWLLLLVALLALPPLVFTVIGAVALWQHGWLLWTWWILPLAWGAAYLVARRLQAKVGPILKPEQPTPLHWTERDQQAWLVVEARAAAAASGSSEQLVDPAYYLRTAESLAADVASVYHPKASDPVGGVTIPELLAALELAAADLARVMATSVPGSHLLTIDRWRMLAKIPTYSKRASDAYWLISGVLNPVQTAARYAASRAGVNPALQKVRDNLVGWFAAAFVQRFGSALIELNSGRLKVGAERYRELHAAAQAPTGNGVPTDDRAVIIVLAGQTGAGKSSVIDLLLGARRDETRVVPAEQGIERHELRLADDAVPLILVDTPGYARESEVADRFPKTIAEMQRADFVLLVLSAVNAARAPDARLLERLTAWWAAHPEIRRPPVIGVLTHIDALSPAREWDPPYDDWRDAEPTRAKSKSIRAAVDYQAEALGSSLESVVPICGATDRAWGVGEALAPMLLSRLDDARAAKLVRGLHREGDGQNIDRLLQQLKGAGAALWRAAVGHH